MPLIDQNMFDSAQIKKVVFCSGKFYFDLLSYMETNEINDVALIRLEQLFPLPTKEIDSIIKKYTQAKEIVWAQEEPRNMGAWSHLLLHLSHAIKFRVASRRFYGSPATGSSARSAKRHRQVIEYVFDERKNNLY